MSTYERLPDESGLVRLPDDFTVEDLFGSNGDSSKQLGDILDGVLKDCDTENVHSREVDIAFTTNGPTTARVNAGIDTIADSGHERQTTRARLHLNIGAMSLANGWVEQQHVNGRITGNMESWTYVNAIEDLKEALSTDRLAWFNNALLQPSHEQTVTSVEALVAEAAQLQIPVFDSMTASAAPTVFRNGATVETLTSRVTSRPADSDTVPMRDVKILTPDEVVHTYQQLPDGTELVTIGGERMLPGRSVLDALGALLTSAHNSGRV